jgi:hypothetical protein
MKRRVVVLMFIIIFFPCAMLAQDQDLGLGFMVGEPTGISFKKWVGSTTAFDGAVGWSFSGQDRLHLHVDYLVHNFDLIKVEKGRLPVYFGIGARLKLEDRTKFGVRIPIGVCYLFEKATLDAFFELVPIFDLVPDTDFRISGSIGIRYYF